MNRSTGRAERDAAFRQAVDEAKQRYNISDVVARTRKVVRAGKNEKRALCAFHNERTPSMQLNDAKGTYHCFGCNVSIGVQKGPPIGVQKRPLSLGGVTVTDAPFALVAA